MQIKSGTVFVTDQLNNEWVTTQSFVLPRTKKIRFTVNNKKKTAKIPVTIISGNQVRVLIECGDTSFWAVMQ